MTSNAASIVDQQRVREVVLRLGAMPSAHASRELDRIMAESPEFGRTVRRILELADGPGEFGEDRTDGTSSERSLAEPDPIAGLIIRAADEVASGSLDLPTRLGRYVLLERLGDGGQGSVYLARQSGPSRDVAIKVLHRCPPEGEPEFEAAALGRLDHPGIVHVYESGVATVRSAGGPKRVAYIVMEHVSGRPITAHADANSLDLERRLKLLVGIARTLHHMHERGVVHGDLKPANILVEGSGRTRIVDFGVSLIAQHGLTRRPVQGSAPQPGTRPYTAPELIGQRRSPDERSDLFTLGVIVGEMLTGAPPAPGTEAATIRDAMATRGIRGLRAHDLSQIVARLIEPEPGARPGSPELVASWLDHVRRERRRGLPGRGRCPPRLACLLAARTIWSVASSRASLLAIVLVAWGVAANLHLRHLHAREALAAQLDDATHRQQTVTARAKTASRSADRRLAAIRSLIESVDRVIAPLAGTDTQTLRERAMAMLAKAPAAKPASETDSLLGATNALLAAHILHRIGDDQAALDALDRSTHIRDRGVALHADLLEANILSGLHRHSEAIELLEPWHSASIAGETDLQRVGLALSDRLISQGHIPRAMAILDRLASDGSALGESPEALAIRARAHRHMGEPDQAELLVRQAVGRLDASGSLADVPLIIQLAGVLGDTGRPVEASTLLEQLVFDLESRLPARSAAVLDARHRLARASLRIGKLGMAERMLAENLRAVSTRPWDGLTLERTLQAMIDLDRRRGETARMLASLERLAHAKADRAGSDRTPDVVATRLELMHARLVHEPGSVDPEQTARLLADARDSSGAASLLTARAHELVAHHRSLWGDRAGAIRHAVLAREIAAPHHHRLPLAEALLADADRLQAEVSERERFPLKEDPNP